MWGDLLALSNGIAYALVQHYMDKDYPISDNSIIGLNNMMLCLVILVLFPTSWIFQDCPWPGGWDCFFWAFFKLAYPIQVFFKGVRMISALKASMVSLLEPLLNPIFVFLFVGEIPSVNSLIGFGIILLGIALTMKPAKTGRQIEEF